MIQIQQTRLHPRVAQQEIAPERFEQAARALAEKVVPFKSQSPVFCMLLIDWDHRLPSRRFLFRLHLFYDATQRNQFEQRLLRRDEQIQARNLFPEFDVADYSDLQADESYEAEYTFALELSVARLVSPWRTNIEKAASQSAIELVRASEQFKELAARYDNRSERLGDLDAVSWTAPCETDVAVWTIEVWWLATFDGQIGTGWSFLVELREKREIVAVKEFSFRATL